MTARKYAGIEAYVADCSEKPSVRKQLVKLTATAFIERMREELSEAQLIGIDYANTYGFMFTHKRSCASFDYCDPHQLMLDAVRMSLAERIKGIRDDDESAPDVFGFLTQSDNPLSPVLWSIWNEAWEQAASKGFSSLWAVKEGVLAESAFKSLATFVMLYPGSGADDPRYPGIPLAIDDEDQLDEIAAAAKDFLANIVPFSAEDAIEVSTVLDGLCGEEGVNGIVEYFRSFAPAPQDEALRP